MATLFDPNKEDELTESGQPTQLNTSGGASATPTSSGRFNNITNYLNANKGSNLAGRIGSNIQTKADTTKGQIGQAVQNFNTASESNRVSLNPDTVSAISTDPTKLVGEGGKVDSDFARQQQGNYLGPTSLDPSGKLQTGVKNVANLANQATSEKGRFNLLSSMFNRPTYTSGQKNLDNLLLQGNKGQMQQLAGTRRTANVLGKDLGVADVSAKNKAFQNQSEAQATKSAIGQALDSKTFDINKTLEDRVKDLIKTRGDDYTTASTEAEKGRLTARDLASLGLKEGQNIYGLDLSKYLLENKIEPTIQNVAKEEEYKAIDALKALLGNYTTENQSNILSQYGNYNPETYIENQPAYTTKPASALQTDLANAQSFYNDAVNARNNFNQVDQIVSNAASINGVPKDIYLQDGAWAALKINEANARGEGANLSDYHKDAYANYVRYTDAKNNSDNLKKYLVNKQASLIPDTIFNISDTQEGPR